MADDPREFKFTAGGEEWTFADETAAEEEGTPVRAAEYDYPAINGVELLLLGDDPRTIILSAWLHGEDAAALRALMDDVNLMRGYLGTLSIRGGETEWTNCIVHGAPKFSRRTPPQADGTVHCRVQITFRQLIPTDPES